MDLRALSYDRLLGPNSKDVDNDLVRTHAWRGEYSHIDLWLRVEFFSAHNKPQRSDTPKVGWKFHVSFDARQAPQAWDAALPVLAATGGEVKLLKEDLYDKMNDPSHRQAGKTLVIYANNAEHLDWTGLLSDLERALRTAGISPSFEVRGDIPVPGSAYIHARNDADSAGGYTDNNSGFNTCLHAWPFGELRADRGEMPPVPPAFMPETRHRRLLDMVSAGLDGSWKPVGDSHQIFLPPDQANMLAGALRAVGVMTTPSPDQFNLRLTLAPGQEDILAQQWHRARDLITTAEIGKVVQAEINKHLDGAPVSITANLPKGTGGLPVLNFKTNGHPAALKFLDTFLDTAAQEAKWLFKREANETHPHVRRVHYGGGAHKSGALAPAFSAFTLNSLIRGTTDRLAKENKEKGNADEAR